MTIIGEISVRPEEFSAAVAWVAKWVTAKPVVPIQAGIAIEAGPNGLTLTAYGENATARAQVGAEFSSAIGTSVVSGRLLAALAGTFGKREPVVITADGAAVRMVVGKWTGQLPAMPEQDWPTLASSATEVGRCVGDDLAAAVERVGVARGTDPKAGSVFMLMHLGLGGEGLELGCTDRYRVAMTSIPFEYAGNLPFDQVTPFAEDMVEAAGAFAGPDPITVGADPGVMSLTGPRRQVVLRLGTTSDGTPWPVEVLRGYITTAMNQPAEVEVMPDEIAMPLKRAGITGGKSGLARIQIADGALTIGAAEDDGAAGDESISVEYTGEAGHGYLNARYFGDAFTSAPGKAVRLKFGTGDQISKPVVAYCDTDPHWRYLTMPVRKP
jgi:DNA polymerase-3 subunit beta